MNVGVESFQLHVHMWWRRWWGSINSTQSFGGPLCQMIEELSNKWISILRPQEHLHTATCPGSDVIEYKCQPWHSMLFFTSGVLSFLQFFQLSSDPVSSPVYCLRFNSSHLYAALATAVHSLDFRQNGTQIRWYTQTLLLVSSFP